MVNNDRCCENCDKLCVSTVMVDFGYDGIQDFDCPELRDMSDTDVDLVNEGRCPRFVPIDWDEVRRQQDEEYECMKDIMF